MKKQVQLIYSGRVQGIGFRYTATEIAGTLNISGWVRNTSGGQVEILAEGEKEDLDSFIDEIGRRMQRYISDCHLQWQEAAGSFKDFQVLF